MSPLGVGLARRNRSNQSLPPFVDATEIVGELTEAGSNITFDLFDSKRSAAESALEFGRRISAGVDEGQGDGPCHTREEPRNDSACSPTACSLFL